MPDFSAQFRGPSVLGESTVRFLHRAATGRCAAPEDVERGIITSFEVKARIDTIAHEMRGSWDF